MVKLMNITPSIRARVFTALIASGVALPSAFVATQLTLPSEGLVTSVYLDPAGLPTKCVGHLDKNAIVGTQVSIDECIKLFVLDWKKHEAQLDSVVKVPYISEWQKAALTDFTFNVGIGNVRSSTLLNNLNNYKYVEACGELSKWVYAKGKKLPGLVIRREETYQYCMGLVPYKQQTAYQQYMGEYGGTE